MPNERKYTQWEIETQFLDFAKSLNYKTRIGILKELGGIPTTHEGHIYHSWERIAFNKIISDDNHEKLTAAIAKAKGGEG